MDLEQEIVNLIVSLGFKYVVHDGIYFVTDTNGNVWTFTIPMIEEE